MLCNIRHAVATCAAKAGRLRNIRRMEERGKIVSMIEDKIKYDIRSVVWDE